MNRVYNTFLTYFMIEGVRRLNPYFEGTPMVVKPGFEGGMQHYASPMTQINHQPVDIDDPQYTKWVRPLGAWDDASAESARNDLETVHQMLDGVAKIAHTVIYDDAAISVEGDERCVYYPSYAMVQEAIRGSAVSEDDLRNVEKIHGSIQAVLSASWEMYKEHGVAVDLVGMDTVKDILSMPVDKERFLRLHNFRKGKDGNPVLIDTRLLEPRRVAPPSRRMTDFLIQFQHLGLQNLLNDCAGGSGGLDLKGGNPAIREMAARCFAFTRRFR